MTGHDSLEEMYYSSCSYIIRSQGNPSVTFFVSLLSLSCDAQYSRRVWQPVVLDLWIMIYYPIKSPDIQRERQREKIKCELLFPLMSTLFLFLLSNPTLGNRAPQVPILASSLVKHDHTATHSPDLSSLTHRSPTATGLQEVSCARTESCHD